MIDFLLNFLPEKSNFLNLFSYLTTRTVLSTLTGLMMVLFLGNTFIERIRSLQFQQSISDRGPESHKLKDGTPTMGGLLIIGRLYLKDCFIEDINIFIDLSKLILFLSEYLHIIGFISLIPISVAFSRNHSNLSLFLVNEIATLSFGDSFLNSTVFSISKIDLFL